MYSQTKVMHNRIRLLRQFLPFFKYCVVGVLGTSIDLFTVYLLVERLELMHPIGAATVGFFLAVINNFFLNKAWTFQNRSKNYRKLWVKFLLVSLVGLLLTWMFMYIFYERYGIAAVPAKAITSVIVLSWNFFANKYWTFTTTKLNLNIPTSFPFELSIIVPAYNEENRIKNTLILFNDFILSQKINAEIIVVSDGSTDGTVKLVKNLQEKISHLRVIANKKNRGKGFAVKTGIEAARGKLILFADADNSTPIEEYLELKKQISKHDIVIGSRWLKNSKVKRKQSTARIFIGRFGNMIIQMFLIDGIIDTQCGFKLFTHEAAKQIFARQKVFGFGFDVELLVIAKNLNYRIAEVPVSWFNSVESRFRPVRDALRTVFDLIYIKLNLWSGRYF